MKGLREYDPLRDYGKVRDLWAAALPARYALAERAAWPRLVGRDTLRTGDGWVVESGRRLIGWGLAEIDRGAIGPDPSGSVQALLVHPDHQREGIGTALAEKIEKRIRAEGGTTVRPGGGMWRFWTGIPEDLPGARAFFERRGYAQNYEAVDLFGPLSAGDGSAGGEAVLAEAGVTAAPVTADRVGEVYDLLTREAPSWRRSYLMLVAAGDAGNVLYFSKGSEGVGCIQTYTPGSRLRGPNLAWEGHLGSNLGGFGAVLIAKAWRGRGLGAALCQAAAAHIRARGAAGCFIDWTNDALADRLYAKVGTSVWMRFGMYARTWADEARA